jgi:phosphatidylglycerophosphatase A
MVNKKRFLSGIKKTIIYIIATGLGSGYAPVAPGTAGSILALLVFWFLPLQTMIWIGILVLVTITGIWAANYIEFEHGKDPGLVVIDEVVGQWIALLFLPHTIKIFLVSFFIFRILDIIKPFPAGRSQKLSGGMGIMLDDIIAGVYTNIIMQLYLFLLL